MIFELCPTLSRDLIKREFLNTAAAFGVLVLLGFAAGMIFPDMAQQTLQTSPRRSSSWDLPTMFPSRR